MQRQRRQDDGPGDGGDPASGPFPENPNPRLPLPVTPLPPMSIGSTSNTDTFTGLPTGTGSSLTISETGPPAPSSTSDSSPPPLTPIWHFLPVNDSNTCEPITIRWELSDNDGNSSPTPTGGITLDLTLKNSPNNTYSTSIELATAQPFAEDPFVLDSPSISAGSYYIQGRDSLLGYFVTSNTFQVTTGPNTTCLGSGGTSTTVSNPSSSSSSQSSSTAMKKTKTAAIAGGTIGGLAGLSMIIFAAFWLIASRRNRRISSAARRRRAHGGWGGLDSVEYKPTSAVLAGAGAPRRSTSTSASIPKEADRLGISAVDVAGHSLSSLAYEKPVQQQVYPPVRSPSQSSYEVTRLAPSSSPSSSPLAATTRRSFESSSVATSTVPDPFTPTSTNTTNKRSSRTARKPVPVYEPTPEELVQLAVARSHSESGILRSDSSSSTSSRNPSPKASSPLSSSLGSASPLSGNLHAQAMLQGLKSKSSGHFAGGEDDSNVHYLIPDPPMSARK